MDKTTQHTIISLLQKYIENTCTEKELYILFSWLKSPENRQSFDEASEALWQSIDKQITYPDTKRAAQLNDEFDILLKIIRKKNKPSTGGINTARRIIISRGAAAIVLLLSIGMGFFVYLNKSKITYEEIAAARGETKEHILSDGTKIFLNAASKIIVPSDYNKNNRFVEMVGEGYFTVTPDPAKPFIIKNGSTKVKVIGTSFNIKSYREDDYISVTVSSGRVLVNVDAIDLQLRVTPMEHLSIRKSTGDVDKSSLLDNKYIDWMRGILYFDKEPIGEVLKTINRKYNKNVILLCKNCNHVISGTHDNKSLEAVIEAICFTTGLKCRDGDNSIILYDIDNL